MKWKLRKTKATMQLREKVPLIWVSPVAGGPGGTKIRNENWHRAAILGSDQSASPAAGDDAGKASAGCGGG